MMTISELLDRSQRAFHDGDSLLAHYLVVSAMYLAYAERDPGGVLRARFHAAQHAGVLSDLGAPEANQEMARFARQRSEFLYTRLRLLQGSTDAAARAETASTETADGQKGGPREAAEAEGA